MHVISVPSVHIGVVQNSWDFVGIQNSWDKQLEHAPNFPSYFPKSFDKVLVLHLLPAHLSEKFGISKPMTAATADTHVTMEALNVSLPRSASYIRFFF